MKRTAVEPYTTVNKNNMRSAYIALGVVFTFSFIGVGLIPFWIHLIPLVIGLPHVYLTETNLATNWSSSSDEFKGWKKYQALPKEYRKIIKVSADEYHKMTQAQRGKFIHKINKIDENYQQRLDAKGLDDGLVARMDAILQADDHAIMIEREVKKEMQRQGW